MAAAAAAATTTSSTLELFFIIFFLLSPLAFSRTKQLPFRPQTLVLPETKDSATNLHVTNVRTRTPFVAIPLLVDVNNKFLWVDCERNFSSTTYRTPFCHSTQCSQVGTHYCHRCIGPARPGCHNNTCGVMTTNPITHQTILGEFGEDIVSIQSARGPSSGPFVSITQFVFSCAPPRLLKGPLPQNVQGVVGLGHNPVAMPYQIASHFGFRPKFALCLTSSTKAANGVIFIGNGPYKLNPGVDVSDPVGFTPLTISPRGEYHIQVNSININNKPLPLNIPKYSKTRQGSFPNALISTTAPYTILEHSIFLATTQFFTNQLSWVPQIIPPVSPFSVCFNSSTLSKTRVGPGVPNIDLVLQNGTASWTIFGANSMVEAREGVLCLGFVDGGLRPRNPIVIGLHQMEDNLLQFDLAKSRLGFSSSLLFKSVTCANFNFTTTP